MEQQNTNLQPEITNSNFNQKPSTLLLPFIIVGFVFFIIGILTGYFLAKATQIIVPINVSSTNTSSLLPSPTVLPTVISSPEVTVITNNLTIQNGNIYNQGKLIINHTKLVSDSIQSFSDIELSPDNSKICFIGWPLGPFPIIYISNTMGENINKVSGNSQHCVWSNDSLKIAFNNNRTDVGPTDIYVYDLNTKLTKNISQNLISPPRFRVYLKQQWSTDNNKIIGDFIETDGSGANEKKGSTEFNLITGKTIDSLQ